MNTRVVIIGAGGFVGSHIAGNLKAQAFTVIPVTRKECDLTRPESKEALSALIQPGDIVVCAAAKAPAKNFDMLTENITMISHIAEALRSKPPAYVLNISSDAVYADSMEPLSETSPIAPMSAHGIMHCMREYILQQSLTCPIGHLRPTLIYGAADPHNGYGPNSFVRAAKNSRKIELFGQGEERRDHIFVEDVAALAVAMIEQKISGAVNAVTGKVISFMDIAQQVKASAAAPVDIHSKPRSGPMPHNGYRAFRNEAAQRLRPAAPFKELAEYIREAVSA